jgi:hypothetical protein
LKIVAEQSSSTDAELMRRHRNATLIVRVFLALTVAIIVAAFVGRNHFPQRDNPALDAVVKLSILVLGFGSLVLRRTRFSPMRLQGIATLKGTTGLLATLESTTIQVALLGVVVAVSGFVGTLFTGNTFYSYGAGLVGLVVLLNCYPTRKRWQQAVQVFGDSARELPKPSF